MLKLYRYHTYCCGQSPVTGVFIGESGYLKRCFGKTIQLGNGVRQEMVEEQFKVLSEDQEKIEWLQDTLGTSISGFNPYLQYLTESILR